MVGSPNGIGGWPGEGVSGGGPNGDFDTGQVTGYDPSSGSSAPTSSSYIGDPSVDIGSPDTSGGAGYASYLAGGYPNTDAGGEGDDQLPPISVDSSLPSIDVTPPALDVGNSPVSIASVGPVQLSGSGDNNVTSVQGTASQDDTSAGQDTGPMAWTAPDYVPPSPSTTTANAATLPMVTVNQNGTSSVPTIYTQAEEAQFQQNWSGAIDSEQAQNDSTRVAAANAEAAQASQQFLTNFNAWQQADAKQFVMFNADIAITGGSFGLASAFGLTGIALTTASAGGVGGYLSGGWQSVPNGIALGSVGGVGLAYSAGIITAASVAGEWGFGTTAAAQFANLVVGDSLTSAGSTLFNNYLNGNPWMSDVCTSAAIGAFAPILSGEVVLAAAGETGPGAAVFNAFTGMLNSVGVAIDANSQHGSSQSQK